MNVSIPGKKINENLESLRGYAALAVVICHIVTFNNVFNRFYVPTFIVELSPDASLWVLVFFVLSGYVIAISHKKDMKGGGIGLYLKKRFTRIYPIYFFALLVTLLVSWFHYSFFEIAMNFVMMQVLVVPPFFQNGPAWSLHYEMLYYLLFIPVSFFRLNPVVVLVIGLVIAFGNYGFYPNMHAPILSSYLFGFAFWIAGLCVARYGVADGNDINYRVLIGNLLLILSISEVFYRSGLATIIDDVAFFIFHRHLLYPQVQIFTQITLSYQTLIFLPFCVYAVCVFSGRKFKYDKALFWVLQALVLCGIIITLRNYIVLGKRADHISHFFLSVGYYLASLLLPFLNFKLINKISGIAIKFGSWLGGISYAMYILHCPLIFALGKINFFNTSFASFIVRFIVFSVVLIGLSYLLERILQPRIKKLLLGDAMKSLK